MVLWLYILPAVVLLCGSFLPTEVQLVLFNVCLSAAVLSAAIYTAIRIFWDWLLEDFIILSALSKYIRLIGGKGSFYTAIETLEEWATKAPNKLALVFEDQKFTFQEYNNRANLHGNAFREAGFSRERKVSLLMRNRPEFMFITTGCMKLGIPVVFLNSSLRLKSLLHCIKEGCAKDLIVDDDPDLLQAVDEIFHDLQSLAIRVFVYGQTDTYLSLNTYLCDAIDTPVDRIIRRDLKPDSLFGYLFTSGTTGLPKAAKITYSKASLGTVFFFIANVKDTDTLYSPLPLFHSAALIFFHMGAMSLGCTLVMARKFSVTNFWKDCAQHNVTVIQYIGETARYLLSAQQSPYEQTHNVRMAIGNGLRKNFWEELQKRFRIKAIREFYAATEGIVGFMNLSEKTGSCGRHSPLGKWLHPKVLFLRYDVATDEVVRDAHGLCIEAKLDEPGLCVGEITPSSPFYGYRDENQTEKKIIKDVLRKGDRYFNSGDLLLKDKNFHIYFVDRVGDTFRWKGENVATLEVAQTLHELDFITDCIVYGVSVPGTEGKAGMAAILLKAEPTTDILKSIFQHCELKLPPYAHPIFIRFISEVQLTMTYKHQKFQLQKEAFDVDLVPKLYVWDGDKKTYIKMDAETYKGIVSGTYRFR